jgi:hypothetical protein
MCQKKRCKGSLEHISQMLDFRKRDNWLMSAFAPGLDNPFGYVNFFGYIGGSKSRTTT